jgi:hypothetical protein
MLARFRARSHSRNASRRYVSGYWVTESYSARLNALEPWDLEASCPYEPAYLADFKAQRLTSNALIEKPRPVHILLRRASRAAALPIRCQRFWTMIGLVSKFRHGHAGSVSFSGFRQYEP